MYLGIEIGGTKLQMGVGDGCSAALISLQRFDIDATAGAAGIRAQIARHAPLLIQESGARRIGVGFGGPVEAGGGRVITSHQVSGWDDFPLAEWCRETLGRETVLGNDCDCAALAEARLGAGAERRVVFYVTVGTGVGGGLVMDGRLIGAHNRAIAEIGHLRPGLTSRDASQTVESLASGRGLEATARRKIREDLSSSPARELLDACGGNVDRLTGKQIAEAARRGNSLARGAVAEGIRALGWGIAQAITLLAPNVVVVGGGVSLMGDALFFEPLRGEVATYVFPPLRNSYQIVPAALGEEVVVHGAIALADDVHR